MHIVANQQRTFLRLLAELRPHWRRDVALPARIQRLLAQRREFGSRDRRLYRELIYTTLRYLPWIEPLLDPDATEAVRRIAWLAAETPATKLFRSELAQGETPTGDNSELLPAWFRAHCPELFSAAELDAQLRRAPLWLRAQTANIAAASAALGAEGCICTPAAVLPSALRVKDDCAVDQTEAYKNGAVEIQDLGSQLLLESIGLTHDERWLDACAGAGGKTLQLAQLVGPGGHVTAHDIRTAALAELQVRVNRAGRRNVTVRSGIDGQGQFDGVLVDAPCSGSGTWRRAPHLKWTTTEAHITQAAAKQARLLSDFSVQVRPGGRLVYATCSLSQRENESVVAAFLETHSEFEVTPLAHTFGFAVRGNGLTIMPSRHDTDGFFVASLRRR